ncbi:unnamed protein product [Adineta ricciae]|uniref:Uncharacterized protein n=1 Tax=Adineta ricciae TaxID=249248 RepID=A0A814HG73_ADIRI|nr:unnamed protein product [Adineta ricciae]
MDAFKRSQRKFRSLPRSIASAIRSISFDRSNDHKFFGTPSSQRRRNGISVDSYNELRKLILQVPLPTTVLQRTPTKEFLLNGIDLPLAASSYYILTLTNQCSTLVLFNKDHEVCRIDLSHLLVLVYDMCWSSKLNLFLMAGYGLYSFDAQRRVFSTLEQFQLARGEWIVSITCNMNSMYLLYSRCASRIECRSLFPPYQLEKQWPQKCFLRRKDFLAQCIRVNEWNLLALTIKQQNGEWRVDLFESTNCLRTIRSCLLGRSVPGMRNCLLIPYERSWLVINNCSLPQQIILIDENGRIKTKTYIDKPHGFCNICFLGTEWIGMNVKDKLRLYMI